MKPCRKCHLPMKPTKNQLAKGDYLCRICTKEYNLAYRAMRRLTGKPVGGSKIWDPAKRKAWTIGYYSRPDVKARKAEQMRRYTRDETKQARHHARWLLRRAVASGRIVRQPCERCSATPTHAHHPDYAKPLEVVWLCRTCHQREHPNCAKVKAEGRQTP